MTVMVNKKPLPVLVAWQGLAYYVRINVLLYNITVFSVHHSCFLRLQHFC